MTKEEKWEQSGFSKKVEQYLSERLQSDLHQFGVPKTTFKESWYFYGKVNTGKSLKAAGMLMNQMKEDFISGAMVMGSGTSYKFITTPDLFMDLRSVYDDPSRTEKQAVEYYCNIDYLVLDDFGVDKISDWVFQMLYLIINRRYENMKPTLFTSNLTLEKISEQLGDDRLSRRIYQMCGNGDRVQKFDKSYTGAGSK